MSPDATSDDTCITNLKYELKKWEKSFADSNGGRKPTREDVKSDASIGMHDRVSIAANGS